MWHVVQQKRGSVLLMDGTLIHRGGGGPGRMIFSPFVPEKFRTPANVVEPENVPDLMFVEPEEPEEEEAEEDPPATSSGSDLQPPAPPWYHRWWIPPPMADNMVRVPVAPGCVYFGFCPSSLVLICAPSAREMQWASMAMHYTASMPSMQAEADCKVKWNGKKKECMCPCNEKVCNYRVFACVKCIVCASVIRTTRTQNRSFTHAK